MSHGSLDGDRIGTGSSGERRVGLPKPLAVIGRVLTLLNRALFVASAIAIVLAALVQTEAVLARNFYGESSEWQEEVTVFLLLGAMFLSMASVQARRGHIGIDALAGILPPGLNRLRERLVDLVSLAFTAFFAWKCCQLLQEAIVDDEHTMSTWGPPLWIPYSLMASGMVLLSLQILLQTIIGFVTRAEPAATTPPGGMSSLPNGPVMTSEDQP